MDSIPQTGQNFQSEHIPYNGTSAPDLHSEGKGLDIIKDNSYRPTQDAGYKAYIGHLRKKIQSKPKYLTPEYNEWRDQVKKELSRVRLISKAVRFDSCGDLKHYVCKCCGHKKPAVHHCELRICPECGELTATKLFFQVKDVIEEWQSQKELYTGYQFKHIILTMAPEKGKPFIDNLRYYVKKAKSRQNAFRLYLKRRFKRFAVLGAYEVGPVSGMLHIHLFAYVPWLNKAELEKVWQNGFVRAVTVKDYRQVLNVCSYVVKFFKGDQIAITPDLAVKVERAFTKVRRIFTWGAFYKRVRLRPLNRRKLTCPLCSGHSFEIQSFPGLKVKDVVFRE